MGPDERAHIASPQTGEIYTFIVERRSQARDGAPPMVYPASTRLTSQEAAELEWGLEQYVQYRSLEDDLSEYMSAWIREKYEGVLEGRAQLACQNARSDDLLCISGTALDTLSDPSKYQELRHKAIDWLAEEYDDRLSRETRVRVTGGGITIAGTGGDIEYEHIDPEKIGGWRAHHYFRNCSGCEHGWEELNVADYLRFDFDINIDHSGNNLYISPTVNFDAHGSRINGRVGWLTEGSERPDEMNECDLEQLASALDTRTVGAPSKIGGWLGWPGGFTRGFGGVDGGVETHWTCGSNRCCTSDNLCLPRSEVEDS